MRDPGCGRREGRRSRTRRGRSRRQGRSSPIGGVEPRPSTPESVVIESVSGVEVERPGQGVSDDHVGRGDEGLGVGVAVVALGKVAVEAGHDGVELCRDRRRRRSHWPMQGPQALASTVPPMASRSASSPSRSMVARTCSEPGRDEERGLGRQAVGRRLPGDRGGPGHVLVGGVGARADQGDRDLASAPRWSWPRPPPRSRGGPGRGCRAR